MAGNWKMNLNHLEAIALVQKLAFSLTPKDLDEVECVVLPPFVDLRSVQTLVDGDRLDIRYGAQDLSPHDSGAHTGDVSGAMLAKLGCSYVVVGHSERRQHHGETDEVVNAKVHAALRHGLTPILCVGEGRASASSTARSTTPSTRCARARRRLRRAGRVRGRRPTSRSGPSAPARSRPRTTRRRCAARSASPCARCTATPSPTPCACSTAAR
jgi:triosephosphate isomerase